MSWSFSTTNFSDVHDLVLEYTMLHGKGELRLQIKLSLLISLQVSQVRLGSVCQCRRQKRFRFDPWLGKIPWSRKWQPTPVLLSVKSHGQRRLMGYSPWGSKDLDMTECTHTHTQSACRIEGDKFVGHKPPSLCISVIAI